MPDRQDQPKIFFQECSHCQGNGVAQTEQGQPVLCPACQGKGLVSFIGGEFFRWGKRINTWSILQNRLQKTIKVVTNILLIIFGLIGLVAGGLEIYHFIQSYSFNYQDLRQYFLVETNPGKLIFWLSLVTDLYAYFRMEMQTIIKHKVKKPTKAALRSRAPQTTFAEIEKRYGSQELSQYFDDSALEIIRDSWQLANRRNSQKVEPVHLLAELVSDRRITVAFTRLGISAKSFSRKVVRVLSQEDVSKNIYPFFSTELYKLLHYAYFEAFLSGRPKVLPQHLFLGIFRVKGMAKEIFLDLEVDYQKAKNVVGWLDIRDELRDRWRQWRSKAVFKPKNTMNKALTARPTPHLDRLGRDLTLAARNGALFPLIDRKREMEEVLQVMQSGKGNVLLVGDSGVGKATMVQGLAQLMASEDVPKVLQDKRLVELSTAALVASGSQGGNVEGRMLTVVDEIVTAGNVILYIDDVSNLVGAGGGGMEESVDVSDVLVSALSRGLVKVIGTVGKGEYSQYLQNNDIVMRNFSKIEVAEPDIDTAILILQAQSSVFENKYQVFFTYDSIEKSVKLSQQYLHDQYLPAKAIKVLEQAAIQVVESKGQNQAVTGEDVAKVISQKTNVKVTKITEEESTKLINLEERIHQRIVNQEEAVKLVASALRRARAELRDEDRPIVNLLFLGPTGVGKTELAKTVSQIYFGGEEKMVRVDMSEFQNKDSLNRLIGYPQSFRGSAAGGYLTEAVRKAPFSLVLLDEFEKAHPDILNLFLQVMEDGRLTDGSGRTVDFSNSIIIATSNAGTQEIQDGLRQGQPIEVIQEKLLTETLKPHFRPELLNRFDSVVVFKTLSMDHVKQIAYLLLNQVKKRLKKKGISLEVSEEAVVELAEAGFDPAMGARPLRRVIQERVDNALAKYLLTGQLSRRDVAVLEKDGKIRVKKAQQI